MSARIRWFLQRMFQDLFYSVYVDLLYASLLTPVASLLCAIAIRFAQFIRICRRLPLIRQEPLVPLENTPFSTQWA